MTAGPADRPCEHCGAVFTPRRSDARYCGSPCRNAAGRARSRSDPIGSAKRADKTPRLITADTAGPLTWDPVIEPRHAYRTAEPCPDCGEPLWASPRGTWRACGPCKVLVVPPTVSAPYSVAQDATQRHVVSQRDRDLAAIDLARRKGIMLAQLDQLAASGRLHAEAVPVAEWLAVQVRNATSGTRLDELAALAADPKAGIRPRHRWQLAAEITAGQDDQDYDDQDLDDQDYEDDQDLDDDDPGPPAPRLAITAGRQQAPTMTWASALTANGWRLSRLADGCQVLDDGRACGTETAHPITGGLVCGEHYAALAATITGRTA